MKYKLKRDLPFAKAGEEVIISATCVYIMGDKKGRGELRETEIYLGSIPQLVGEGWIEEVKPREWWVNMHEGSGNNYFCDSKDEAIRTMWGRPEDNHIVKVREVIE